MILRTLYPQAEFFRRFILIHIIIETEDLAAGTIQDERGIRGRLPVTIITDSFHGPPGFPIVRAASYHNVDIPDMDQVGPAFAPGIHAGNQIPVEGRDQGWYPEGMGIFCPGNEKVLLQVKKGVKL